MIFGPYLSSRQERTADPVMVPTWFHRPVKLAFDLVVGGTRNPLKAEPEAGKALG